MERHRSAIFTTIISPFQRFFRIEAAGGIILLASTIIAIFWANSKWGDYYESFWDISFSIRFANFIISDTLLTWVNEGLMAIFFFVLGLEIKREFIAGELSAPRQAVLPIFAAIGGMVFPALIYVFLNKIPEASSGWAIPTSTDIAFSLGLLSLLGKRVPLGLKVFLLAFAIVDNLAAVLITALFYASDIQINYLLIGAGLYLYLILFNFFKLRIIHFYMLFGWVIWYMFYKSGIHPSVAGILVALTIPIGKKIKVSSFRNHMESNLKVFFDSGKLKKETLNDDQLASIDNMESEIKKVQSPLQSLQLNLHGLVTFFILPVFALANAGIIFNPDPLNSLNHSLSQTIMISLVAGKVFGIFTFTFLLFKLGIGVLPFSVKPVHILGISFLGGIGFNISLFVTNLAFDLESLLNPAKIGILAGSLVAGFIGFILLRLTLKKVTKEIE